MTKSELTLPKSLVKIESPRALQIYLDISVLPSVKYIRKYGCAAQLESQNTKTPAHLIDQLSKEKLFKG